MNDEFYIGWESRAAPAIGRTARMAVRCLLILALVAPIVLAVSQRMIGASVFEWGAHKSVSGVLQVSPYPHLLVRRPGRGGLSDAFSTYYLVAPWKFGLKPAAIAAFDGKAVRVKGTLIYRGGQTMIETKPAWIQAEGSAPAPQGLPPFAGLGRQTLVGEIVDSKCYLGAMNPGDLTTHRACAIRCISGGCPPIFLVRQKDGPPLYLLLASPEGRPVNSQVLDLVAEPLQITGDVERQGSLLILRADPATYRRVR